MTFYKLPAFARPDCSPTAESNHIHAGRNISMIAAQSPQNINILELLSVACTNLLWWISLSILRKVWPSLCGCTQLYRLFASCACCTHPDSPRCSYLRLIVTLETAGWSVTLAWEVTYPHTISITHNKQYQ